MRAKNPSNNLSNLKRKRSSRPMTADPLQPSRRLAVVRKRRCLRCANPLARQARADAKYCSTKCRVVHWRRRRRTTRALTRKLKCAGCGCGKRLAITCRADALYCSTVCRQRSYRRRKAAAAAQPRMAHQRVIREQHAAAANGMQRTADIKTAVVRPITIAEAKAIVLQYEWLGTMPAVSRYCFGIFFDGELGGVVVYGDEYAENLKVWDQLRLQRADHYPAARRLRSLGASAFGQQTDPPLDGSLARALQGGDRQR